MLDDVVPTKYDFQDKIRAIEQISKKININLEHFMYVGDGKEDIDLFKYFYKKNTVRTVAFPAKEIVEHEASIKINGDNIYKIIDAIN